MLKKILIGVAVIIVAFIAVVALQPSDYRVTRSATIAAPAADVFAQVNNFKNWETWSPWAKLDPAAKATFEGPAAGTGAIFKWDGNAQVGAGTMTLMESRPGELVRIKLDFVKPMAATSTAEFTFKPQGNQTELTVTVTGEKNFLAKAFCLFMSMDKMIGGKFEKAFVDLKAIAESPAK